MSGGGRKGGGKKSTVAKGSGKKQGQGAEGTNIRKMPADKKVWLSGLPEGMDKAKREKVNKDLQRHLSQKGIKCKVAEVWKNGNGRAGFATAKDVEKALQ